MKRMSSPQLRLARNDRTTAHSSIAPMGRDVVRRGILSLSYDKCREVHHAGCRANTRLLLCIKKEQCVSTALYIFLGCVTNDVLKAYDIISHNDYYMNLRNYEPSRKKNVLPERVHPQPSLYTKNIQNIASVQCSDKNRFFRKSSVPIFQGKHCLRHTVASNHCCHRLPALRTEFHYVHHLVLLSILSPV